MLIEKLLTIHFQTLGPNTSVKLERNLLGTRLFWTLVQFMHSNKFREISWVRSFFGVQCSLRILNSYSNLFLKKKKIHIQTFSISSRFSLVLTCCHIVKRCGITRTHLWWHLCLEFGSDSEVMRNATNTKWCMRDKFSEWLNCQFLCREEATTPSERRQRVCLDRTYFVETENLLLKLLQQNNF